MATADLADLMAYFGVDKTTALEMRAIARGDSDGDVHEGS